MGANWLALAWPASTETAAVGDDRYGRPSKLTSARVKRRYRKSNTSCSFYTTHSTRNVRERTNEQGTGRPGTANLASAIQDSSLSFDTVEPVGQVADSVES